MARAVVDNVERSVGHWPGCARPPEMTGTEIDPTPVPGTVHVFGTVFFDLVFSGLSAPPRPGTEVRTDDLGLSPGGAANVAVALSRLGVTVRLSSAFADDAFGHYLWTALEHEGIDLTPSCLLAGWTTPLTVSLAYGRERSMVTHQTSPADGPHAPEPAACTASERGAACFVSLGELETGQLAGLHERFATVFADVGWDPKERWEPELLEQLGCVDVFLPNAAEATSYTRQDDVEAAALRLAEYGSLVVVKRGAAGALAAGAGLHSPLGEPGIPTEALDTTGAGDVFDAGFIYATLAGWPISWRLRFANLCAGESVTFPGGSLSAPCWRDLRAWWDRQQDDGIRRAYEFLPDLLDARRSLRPCQRPLPSLSAPGPLGAASSTGR